MDTQEIMRKTGDFIRTSASLKIFVDAEMAVGHLIAGGDEHQYLILNETSMQMWR